MEADETAQNASVIEDVLIPSMILTPSRCWTGCQQPNVGAHTGCSRAFTHTHPGGQRCMPRPQVGPVLNPATLTAEGATRVSRKS